MDTTTSAYQLALKYTFALCVYREERYLGSSHHDARVGIAHVLLNRSANPKAPYAGCTDPMMNAMKPAQFSSFNSHDPNASVLPSPFDVGEWPVWCDCVDVTTNPGPDPTNGSTHYHSYPQDRKDLWPAWATDDKFTVKLGPVYFYKL